MEEFKEVFNNTEKLYHYTKYKNAIKILKSKTLLFAFPKMMNDLTELHRNVEISTPTILTPKIYNKNYLNAAQTDYNKYQQLSLSMDKKRGRMGFDISAMWAHYAEYGKGICLVFNKEKLLDFVNAKDQKRMIISDKITYRKQYSNHVFYALKDNHAELSKNFEKTAFFRKTNDWSYEQEFRIVQKADSKKRIVFNYGDSLLAVIMHLPKHLGYENPICQSAEYKQLKDILGEDFPILEYSFWFGNSFLALDGTTVWTSEPINWENVKLLLNP